MMPFKEKTIEKLYYSISEVADMFGVNNSLIRFWEKEFDIIRPKKNKKGNRMFTKEDIENFRVIYHLVKERGFTLQGAQQKLKENKSDTVNKVEVIHRLGKVKEFLLDLKENVS
jgi:DNA-binding transcriptional MerR regulator